MIKNSARLTGFVLIAIACETNTNQHKLSSKKKNVGIQQTHSRETKRETDLLAKEIIKTQRKKQIIDHEIEELELEVQRHKKKPTIRTLKKIISKHVKHSKETFYTLTVFTSPKQIRGTAVIVEKNEHSSTTRLYMPAVNKLTTLIDKKNKKKYFMNTDLSYEDLQINDYKWTYSLQSKNATCYEDQYTKPLIELLNTKKNITKIETNLDPCYQLTWVIDEKDKPKSSYRKIVSFITKDTYNTTMLKFYGKEKDKTKETPIKILVSTNFTPLIKEASRPKFSVMINPSKKSHTFLTTLKNTPKNHIDSTIFTKRALLKQSYLKLH